MIPALFVRLRRGDIVKVEDPAAALREYPALCRGLAQCLVSLLSRFAIGIFALVLTDRSRRMAALSTVPSATKIERLCPGSKIVSKKA